MDLKALFRTIDDALVDAATAEELARPGRRIDVNAFRTFRAAQRTPRVIRARSFVEWAAIADGAVIARRTA